MELSVEDKQIIINLLNRVQLPVAEATRVLEIIQKLQINLMENKDGTTKGGK